jgi:hypothetical protein
MSIDEALPIAWNRTVPPRGPRPEAAGCPDPEIVTRRRGRIPDVLGSTGQNEGTRRISIAERGHVEVGSARSARPSNGAHSETDSNRRFLSHWLGKRCFLGSPLASVFLRDVRRGCNPSGSSVRWHECKCSRSTEAYRCCVEQAVWLLQQRHSALQRRAWRRHYHQGLLRSVASRSVGRH